MIWQITELNENLVSFLFIVFNFACVMERWRMQFLAKVFQPILFSLCKNTLRTLSLCIWAENNRGTIESIVLEQWKKKNKLNLRKMCLTLTKQKCNSSESSAGVFLSFFFHLLRSEFHQFNQVIVFHQSNQLVYFMHGQSFICFPCASLNVYQHCSPFQVSMTELQKCIFKGYLSRWQRGAEVQSISEKK